MCRRSRCGSPDLLVDDWLLVPVLGLAQLDDEVALFVDPQAVGAVETQPDASWIRRGGNDPVVFEISIVAVVDKIDPGIDALVPGPSIVENGGAPLVGSLPTR